MRFGKDLESKSGFPNRTHPKLHISRLNKHKGAVHVIKVKNILALKFYQQSKAWDICEILFESVYNPKVSHGRKRNFIQEDFGHVLGNR